jgi:uncharacterized protein
MEKKYRELKKIVEKEFSQDTTHTIDHVMRVYHTAMLIASDHSNVDMDVLKTSVLLHDIARVKEDADNTGNIDHAILGAIMAKEILEKLNYPQDKISKITNCIKTHRYRSGGRPESIEAEILFDADKIDLLGSIGIARTYMIAGEQNQRLYSFTKLDEYVNDNLVDKKPNGRIKDISKHAPNLEFETKIKNIPKKLFTSKAKEIAKERIEFMEEFFIQLKKEIGENS